MYTGTKLDSNNIVKVLVKFFKHKQYSFKTENHAYQDFTQNRRNI